MVTFALVIACAVGTGAGLAGLAGATSGNRSSPDDGPAGAHRVGLPTRWRSKPTSWWVAMILLPGLAGAAIGAITRWPVGALLAFAAAAGIPVLLRQAGARGGADRVEAIATWTEQLRDTLAASAGLTQAIISTSSLAPAGLRSEVAALATRLQSGMPLPHALGILADEMGDPSVDIVVCALLLAAECRAQRLGDLLGALADAAREEVAMRLRVEASRASARSGVRTVVIFSVAFAGALAVLAHSYLLPFGSVTGQVVLAGVGLCYAGGLWLMVLIARPPVPVRILGAHTGELVRC
jgi:Flp pilus assembly protein TadB